MLRVLRVKQRDRRKPKPPMPERSLCPILADSVWHWCLRDATDACKASPRAGELPLQQLRCIFLQRSCNMHSTCSRGVAISRCKTLRAQGRAHVAFTVRYSPGPRVVGWDDTLCSAHHDRLLRLLRLPRRPVLQQLRCILLNRDRDKRGKNQGTAARPLYSPCPFSHAPPPGARLHCLPRPRPSH